MWIQTAAKAFRGIPRFEKGLLSLAIEEGGSPPLPGRMNPNGWGRV
jgi:hypothetical protein